MTSAAKWVAVLASGAVLLGGAWLLRTNLLTGNAGASVDRSAPVPVEVAAVRVGPMERRREFTGTLEPAAELIVAAKVGGRLEKITVDLADPVQRGQVVAVLDDEEFRSAEAQAKAALAVARARAAAAANALKIAKRSFDRMEGLHGQSVVSEQELDTVRADKLEAEAAVTVAASEVTKAKAALKEARVREAYTEVRASWAEEDTERVVAARYADEGTMVTANAPLLSIVDLDPVVVVVHVTERDYATLEPGQTVELTTDAYPGETFEGSVDRIAPVFREQSRQARVELRVPNPDQRLKPGMFVRASTVLEQIEEATVVPEEAIVSRDGQDAVFVVSDDRQSVSLRPVEIGVRQGGGVAVTGDGIRGDVVTLGQQRLEDGSAIVIPAPEDAP